MRKSFLCILCLTLTLSAAAIPASAEAWWVTSGDKFTPVGDVEIQWDSEAASVIVFDGDLSEWCQYAVTEIGADSLVSWIGGSDESPDPAMPKDFSIRCRFVADENGLYIGLDMTDDRPYAAPDSIRYISGDAVQIGLDIDNISTHLYEQNPFRSKPMDIFYSVCLTPKDALFGIVRQETDVIGTLYKDSTDPQFNGIDGCTAVTSRGWCAEVFLSWNRLIQDVRDKFNIGDDGIFPADSGTYLEIGCTLCYLDHTDSDTVTWAAHTVKGSRDRSDSNGSPPSGFLTYDNGIRLILPYRDGMTFRESALFNGNGTESETSFIQPGQPAGTHSEAPTEAPAEASAGTAAGESEAGNDVSAAAVTQADTDAGTPDTSIDTAQTGGCQSGVGGAAALLAALVAAYALKKH